MKEKHLGKEVQRVWQGGFMHMPVNTPAHSVVRSPGKAAPLGVLCLRVGASKKQRVHEKKHRGKERKRKFAVKQTTMLPLAMLSKTL